MFGLPLGITVVVAGPVGCSYEVSLSFAENLVGAADPLSSQIGTYPGLGGWIIVVR